MNIVKSPGSVSPERQELIAGKNAFPQDIVVLLKMEPNMLWDHRKKIC
jgi:hypothetical protein